MAGEKENTSTNILYNLIANWEGSLFNATSSMPGSVTRM